MIPYVGFPIYPSSCSSSWDGWLLYKTSQTHINFKNGQTIKTPMNADLKFTYHLDKMI